VQPAVDPALARARPRFRRPGGDFRLKSEVGGQVGHGAVDRGQVREHGFALAGDQDAKDQPAPDRHLLNVRNAQREPGEGAEQPRGDAGPVPAGQRDQERWLVHLVITVPRARRPV
jgi:hypothetical protein